MKYQTQSTTQKIEKSLDRSLIRKMFMLSTFLITTPSLAQMAGPNLNHRPQDASIEIAHVQARMDQVRNSDTDPFPMPRSTISELATIESEMTPSATEQRFSMSSPVSDGACFSREIQISYKIDDESRTEVFTAILRTPRVRWSFASASLSPVIVIQPTLTGPGPLESNGITPPLCRNGFASIVPTETMLSLPSQLPDLSGFDRNLRIEMIRARRMVDVVSQISGLDAQKIGVIGFSRGAIAGGLLMGIEPRIRFGFLGAGGVGVGRIIARSQTEKGISDNAAQMAAFTARDDRPMLPAEYENKLIESIRYDGAMFAHRINPARVKLMIVANDQSVSTVNQRLMRDLICRDHVCPETIDGVPQLIEGHPEFDQLSGGNLGPHVGAIVNLVFVRPSQFIDFFKQQIR